MSFLDQLKRKREAASLAAGQAPAGPGSFAKDPAEMTPEELDAELKRAEEQVRREKIRAVGAWRDNAGSGATAPRRRRSIFSQGSPRRPYR